MTITDSIIHMNTTRNLLIGENFAMIHADHIHKKNPYEQNPARNYIHQKY